MNKTRPWKRFAFTSAFKIAVLYAIAGMLWILFSDKLLQSFTDNPQVLTEFQTIKGWFYIIITSLILFFLIGRIKSKLEVELIKSESKYRLLVEQASDGIFVSDEDGNFIDVNTSGCLMLGYTKRELIGKKISDILLPEELKEKPIRIDELKTGATLLLKRTIMKKDGSNFKAEVSAKMLPDGRLQGIVRDISTREI